MQGRKVEGKTAAEHNAIMSEVCETMLIDSEHIPLSMESYCDDTQLVVEAHETLDIESFINLYQKTWVPPKPLPSGKMVTLIRGVWDIFENVWACRNGILHSKDSELLERTDILTTSRLMEFRRSYTTMLRSCDRFIIAHHSPADVIRWSMPQKKAILAILEKLHCRYTDELKLEAARYRDIRNYFVKLTGSVEEAGALPPG